VTGADPACVRELRNLHGWLLEWLVESAYPLWAARGIDAGNGGFVEALSFTGEPLPEPRRARVQPRQVHAFAQAAAFGWRGDSPAIVRNGIGHFNASYRRDDGLFRTLVSARGRPLDERALLYDQSFALLGFAAAAAALDARREFERRALDLRHRIEHQLAAADGAFLSEVGTPLLRESNPHMHLLEACLEWADTGNDAGWRAWAMSLVDLALSRFIAAETGALHESFTAAWLPAPGAAGRRVEPGHQFEWAWLLLRCMESHPAPLRRAALELLAVGESGVRDGAALNALDADLSVTDANARLWPQTERLKAALLAATTTGESRYWRIATEAAATVTGYLGTAHRGLWFDLRRPDGCFAGQAVPASSFYHLAAAVAALDAALNAAPAAPSNCAR
jgi:mannose-6-phosphate isomerase